MLSVPRSVSQSTPKISASTIKREAWAVDASPNRDGRDVHRQKLQGFEDGVDSIMAGEGFVDNVPSPNALEFWQSRAVLQIGDVGKRSNFAGFVVFHEPSARTLNNGGVLTSPSKKLRTNNVALDLMLVDKSGACLLYTSDAADE